MACDKVLALILALAAMAAVSTIGSAQSTSGCSSSIVGLAPCLNYISGNTSTPSSSCCSQLSGVVKSDPQCLCLLLNGGASSFGVTLNQTRALELPSACNVQTPPVSLCSAVTGAKSPSASPGTPTTSTGGSKNTPSPQSSDAASYKWSSSLMVAIIFAAASISFIKL